jgi:hypothetical protein
MIGLKRIYHESAKEKKNFVLAPPLADPGRVISQGFMFPVIMLPEIRAKSNFYETT